MLGRKFLYVFCLSCLFSIVAGEDFVVGDSNVTVTNVSINPTGLNPGDSITFQGDVRVSVMRAVRLDPVPSNLTIQIEKQATIFADRADAVQLVGNFDGFFSNEGTIFSGNTFGVQVTGANSGRIENHGTIDGFAAGIVVQSLTPGASIANFGSIGSQGFMGGGISVFRDFTGTIENYGIIQSAEFAGLVAWREMRGLINNSGTIRSQIGMDLRGTVSGRVVNKAGGAIEGTTTQGILIRNLLTGEIVNYGSITGEMVGISINQAAGGRIRNEGVIRGVGGNGIETINAIGFANIVNHGGRIQGNTNSILLGSGGRVVASGPAQFQGIIDGAGSPNDILRFENMRGISDAKREELLTLAEQDNPGFTQITLFGEPLAWQNFEDIQVDGASLQSYQSLISGPGLGQFASALDNVNGLTDDFRDFLRELNDAPESELNDIASNLSGQTFQNAVRDVQREQSTTFFSQLANQFSSLRGDVSGGLASNQGAVRNTGLFTQEVQVGMTVAEPGDANQLWVNSYFGRGEQDANRGRSSANYDNTSVLFGGGTEIAHDRYLGAFGGYTRSDGSVDGFGSEMENEGGWFGINGQIQSGDVFASFAGAIGFQDIHSRRRDFTGNQFEGDTEALTGFLYSQVGRDYIVEVKNGEARVTPYLGMTLSSQKVDAFTERGPVGAALRFSDETITEFQTALGVSVAGYWSLPNGWIRPRADLAWWHSFSGSSSYSAGLGAPGLLPGFAVSTPSANDDRAVFQVGFEFGCDKLDGWTFEVGYFGVLGSDDYESHGGTFGARLDF